MAQVLSSCSSPAEAETSFSDLPNNVKEQIFRQLAPSALKNCRLISKQLFHVINSISKLSRVNISDENWPSISQVAKSLYHNDENEEPSSPSPVRKVHSLSLTNLTVSLPILSSTRTQLPLSHKLCLKKGISADNLGKLLRYQLTGLSSLSLDDMCFNNLDTLHVLKNGERTALVNLTKLSIVFWYEIHKHMFLDYHKHVEAIGEFLLGATVSNLRTFKSSIDFPELQEPFQGVVKKTLMENLSKNFATKFIKFLEKHGPQLTKFHIYLNGINLLAILTGFPHLLPNVSKLKFRLHEASGVQKSEIAEALSPFQMLTSLTVSVPAEFESQLTSVLLPKNISTIKNLRIQQWLNASCPPSSLSWLIVPNAVNTNRTLNYLELRLKTADPEFFKLQSGDHQRYEKLTAMKLYLHTPESTLEFDRVHRVDVANWISTIMPNLIQLELFSTNKPIEKLCDLKTLISGLHELVQLDLHDCWKQLRQHYPLKIEKWCASTNGIHGQWNEDGDFDFYRIESST